jgi:hypothetical protein
MYDWLLPQQYPWHAVEHGSQSLIHSAFYLVYVISSDESHETLSGALVRPPSLILADVINYIVNSYVEQITVL